MNDTLGVLRALLSLDAPSVLATLVQVEGSTYRRPGARLLLGPDGPIIGAVSGGCLEADLRARVQEVLVSGRPLRVRYDLGSDLDRVWGTGMGCQGVADLLLEAVAPGRLAPWVPFCEQLLGKRKPCAVVTVLEAPESGGCSVGDRFAYDAREHGLQPFDQDLNRDFGRWVRRALSEDRVLHASVEAPGGPVGVMVEPLRPPMALWIFGAAEGARPLAALAATLGWEVGLVDHREALATAERFPAVRRILVGAPSEVIPRLPVDERCAAVILSHVYDRDKEALAAFLSTSIPYIGLQGHRKRSERLLAELASEVGPLTEDQRRRLHFPVGLDLGGDAPESIALAVLAEAHAVLHGRSGAPLRLRAAPIH